VTFGPRAKFQNKIFLPKVKFVSAASIPVGKMRTKAIPTATESENNIR